MNDIAIRRINFLMNINQLIHRFQAAVLGAGLMLGAVSCSSSLEERQMASRCWWRGDGVAGKPRIVIDLSQQRIRYFKDDQLVGVSPISSGRESHATVNGKFSIIEKDIDHRSSVYGAYVDEGLGYIVQGDVDTRVDPKPEGTKFIGASMRYFMRITGGVGMHEGYLPGYPASHGCIRVPTKMAEIFYNETPHGTPVEIIGQGTLAATEDEIPLGHDSVEVAYEPPPEPVAEDVQRTSGATVADADASSPAASVRSSRQVAEVRTKPQSKPAANAPKSIRYNPARLVKFKKPPRGSTLYLEE